MNLTYFVALWARVDIRCGRAGSRALIFLTGESAGLGKLGARRCCHPDLLWAFCRYCRDSIVDSRQARLAPSKPGLRANLRAAVAGVKMRYHVPSSRATEWSGGQGSGIGVSVASVVFIAIVVQRCRLQSALPDQAGLPLRQNRC